MSRARIWATAAITSLLIPLLPAQPAAAEGVILSAQGKPIAGSYIVTLKNEADVKHDGVHKKAKDLSAKYSGRLGFVYSKATTGFSVALSARQARKLAANADVASVEQNAEVTIADVQNNPPSWGLDRIDQAALPLSSSYTYNTTASNVHAYIIDTGILTTHTNFGGRATSGIDTVDNDSNATDCNGHGTHVAGTVGGSTYGVAKAVQLVGVRVLDCAGSGTNAGVIAGVDWVTANAIKPAVANMSLGGSASTALDTAVANSISSGVTYAVAAGNSNVNACNSSPARTASAITVGATASNDARASYSNYGSCLDIFAPGSDITSAWYTGTSASNTISGTSMASPHVAGAAALVLAGNPAYTPAQVTTALTGAATTGVVTSPGTGSPNRLLFTTTGGGTTPTPNPCAAVSNGNNVTISDNSTVTSTVAVSGCTGSASSTSTVAVSIVHTYRGDLVIDLVAPDGTAYRLKNSSSSDGTDNVNATYSVNASAEAANGTWTLRVQDVYSGDTGYLDTWTLDL